MLLLKLFLLPISYLYGLVVALRNKLFDWGILKSRKFDVPVISVGNITVGGTGKSPHVLYLLSLLENNYKMATVSRGYKRKTKGFLLVESTTTADQCGDEPKQFKFNHPNAIVAVGEKRANAIESLLNAENKPEIVLLDDAFQHRWVKPGLSILLLDYNHFQEHDFMLPAGTLREFPSGQTRADIIIMTKSPKILSPMEKRRFTEIINPLEHQSLFFSFIEYKGIKPLTEGAKAFVETMGDYADYKMLLFTGIANSQPLKDFLYHQAREVLEIKFPDHYDFKTSDLERIASTFKELISSKKILLTTEKDAMRLKDNSLLSILEKLPLFYIPIEIKFHKENSSFDDKIFQFLSAHKANS